MREQERGRTSSRDALGPVPRLVDAGELDGLVQLAEGRFVDRRDEVELEGREEERREGLELGGRKVLALALRAARQRQRACTHEDSPRVRSEV